MKKRARASNDLTTEEPQPTDGDTCADVQSDFMEFVRSSLNNLNKKLDVFIINQKKGGTSAATL